ncbi:iron ABC transporter permease [Nocardioides mangrovicus]|uniref:Iron ABC transporter permease n=1 Tax=Nocardioides mangrovicus TaxID=2478913 RepID=A0A3L8P596_9ACTN|nr:iron ABC transporter permease [Nocardioides mangrovicus]RLV49943.1 iron ABC transporter permease [Nocardioides mangrovicus]
MSATTTSAEAVARVRLVRRRTARRGRLIVAVLTVVLLAAFAARVLLGDYLVTVPDLVRVLSGENLPGTSFVVLDSKLPRAVGAVLAGAAFGLGGALFQTVLRNPLASPDIIGIGAGASAAAVAAIVLFGVTGGWLAVWAVVGALGTGLAILLLAGPRSGARLVLIGVACSAALVSVVQYLFTRASLYDAQEGLLWITGSLNQAAWPGLGRLAVEVLVLVAATAALAPRLAAAELGADSAAGLGVPVRGVMPLLLVGVLLTALATAVTGPIAFVGLIAGPLSRRLNRDRVTLPGAALVGAVVVEISDYIGAYAVPETNLPVGVITGAVGAVVLIWLIARDPSRRRA